MKSKLKNTVCANQKNNIVGADDSVCPLLKRNTQNGITLVALVITIIVLLILAMVSIKIAVDGGLTTKAADATKQHTIGAEKEAIQTGYAAYQVDLANKRTATLTIEGAKEITQLTDGWNIMFNTGNTYKLELNGTVTLNTKGTESSDAPEELIKYLIGENGKSVMSLVDDDGKFKDDPNTIADASSSIAFVGMSDSGSDYVDYAYAYVKYKDKNYKIKFKEKYIKDMNIFDMKTISVNKIVELQKSEGKRATYNGKEYIILYQYDDNTVEMVSKSTMGSLKLGYDDIEAKGNDKFEKAVYSYNNAIKRINDYCKSLYADDKNVEVRSVGSDPKNPYNENSTLYTDNFLKEHIFIYDGRDVNANQIIKSSSDKNNTSDIERMTIANCLNSSDRKDYFLSSRLSYSTFDYLEETDIDSDYHFDSYIKYYSNDEYIGTRQILSCQYDDSGSYIINDAYVNTIEMAVRPVIKISLDKIQIEE